MTRIVLVLAAMVLLLATVSVAHAQQSNAATIETVAITSAPGEDGGYAIEDEVKVGLTFSEAVTVTSAPQLSINVGGQNRTAEYSAGSGSAKLVFTYTVAVGDEDTDGIAVVANSLALNGGTIRAGATNSTLTHAALQANDHRVDGVAPTVTVGEEPRTFVPPGRQLNVVFYFSERVYGLTDSEITVTNGTAHDVAAPRGNATWPRYTRWDVQIQPAAEGPVTVTLQADAATDAYGNGNTAPGSALSVIAADPAMVEVTRTTSGFAEGGKAAFIITRSRDNGAIPVSLSLDQTGDFLSGTVEVYPPPDPDMPEEPVTPTEVEFTETPLNLNVTFTAGETSKRISVLTEDDSQDEDDGTVTLSVPAKADQYKYIPGYRASATADVRDNDDPVEVVAVWVPPYFLPHVLEGDEIHFLVGRRIDNGQLSVYGRLTGSTNLIATTTSRGLEFLDDGRVRVDMPAGQWGVNVYVDTVEDTVDGEGGTITFELLAPGEGAGYVVDTTAPPATATVLDDDAVPTVTVRTADSYDEGDQVVFTFTRSLEFGDSLAELPISVLIEESGDHLAEDPASEAVTVTFPQSQRTVALRLDTVDDVMSESNGSVTATVQPDAYVSYRVGDPGSAVAVVVDGDLPTITVEPVQAEVTEGSSAAFRLLRIGNSSASTTVGLFVGGHQKVMTPETEAIVLASVEQGVVVDQNVTFEPGETEKTLTYTTQADNVVEGDGLISVRIFPLRAAYLLGDPYSADVLIVDDDIPTVSIRKPVSPATTTLSEDGTTWEGTIVEAGDISFGVDCTGEFQFTQRPSPYTLKPLLLWVQENNHPAVYGQQYQERVGFNQATISFYLRNCEDRVIPATNFRHYRYVGPEGGEVRIDLSQLDANPHRDLLTQYEQAKAEAERTGTLITQPGIFGPGLMTNSIPLLGCRIRFCPKYTIGAPNAIRLDVSNRSPTVLIKAESTEVEEGEPARFIVERRWNSDQLNNPEPDSVTLVALRASVSGRYITADLPAEITFGRNATTTVIELPTVNDLAFAPDGSVTIEFLHDTTGANVNIAGKYEFYESWLGHTPEGGRSDRATITIRNDDKLPGLSIDPDSGPEGDSGSTSTLDFRIALNQPAAMDVRVNWSTTDGTATAGSDYAARSGTLTIPSGSTFGSVSVTITGDDISEADETFMVTISSPAGAAIIGGATAAATGTIENDDLQVVTVTAMKERVDEGDAAVFMLTRSGYTDEELEVHFPYYQGGHRTSQSATFEVGATTTEVSLPTTEDSIVNYPPEKEYRVELLGDDQYGNNDRVWEAGDPATSTVVAVDDEEPIFVTVRAEKSVVKESEPAPFVFRRTGDLTVPLEILAYQGVHETFRQSPDGPTANLDPRRITFPANSAEFTIDMNFFHGEPLLDSVLSGPDSPISRGIVLAVLGGISLDERHQLWQAGEPSQAMVFLYDDDNPRGLSLSAEYPGFVTNGQTVDIDFKVTNNWEPDTGATTTVSTNKAGLGCEIMGPITQDSSQTCKVSIVADKQVFTSGYLRIEATATDGISTSNTVRFEIKIKDGGTVGFVDAGPDRYREFHVNRPVEGGEKGQFRRRGPGGLCSYTVRQQPGYSGRGLRGQLGTPGLLTFPAGTTTATIIIDILEDEVDEPRERFMVVLSPIDEVLIDAGGRSRQVTIIDQYARNDPYRPTATLHYNEDGPVKENAGPVEFAVTAGPAFRPASDV